MKSGRPLVVWIATISLFLVLAFQATTLVLALTRPNWAVQPIQALLMVPSAAGFLLLAFPRKWGHMVGTIALGMLLVWFIATVWALVAKDGLRNLEFILGFVVLWTWLFFAFAFGKPAKAFFANKDSNGLP